MIGIALLLVALYLYFQPKYRYISYFLYFSFMAGSGGGFNLWTDSVVGFKLSDCALIYTVIVISHFITTGRSLLPGLRQLKFYKYFLCFFALSFLFSLVHYGLSFYEVLQGGRKFILLLSLVILIRVKPYEFQKIMRMMMWICFITSILYIGQVILKRPLMPYCYDWSADRATGIMRFYNMPVNLALFLTLSFAYPQLFRGTKVPLWAFRVVFFVAQICTLGRTGIAVALLTVLLALAIQGSVKRVVKVVLVLGILITPFIGTLSQRFEGGNTDEDLGSVLSGKFGNDYDPQASGDATMLYRFAWCYERADYLVKRPFLEQVFGLGLTTESSEWQFKRYNFRIGLPDKNFRVAQLGTPDISYGNMITFLGFGGMFLYMCMIVGFARILWKHRKNHPCMPAFVALILMSFVGGFSGSDLSEPRTLTTYFLAMALIVAKQQQLRTNQNRI